MLGHVVEMRGAGWGGGGQKHSLGTVSNKLLMLGHVVEMRGAGVGGVGADAHALQSPWVYYITTIHIWFE